MLNRIVLVFPGQFQHGPRFAQYGCESACDGTHEEAGFGHELVHPASLSLHHPVIWNRADMARKGITQQFVSVQLTRNGQGHDNVIQSDLDVSELHWQRMGIGLVPALEQTLRALHHELHVANTCRVSPSLLILGSFLVNMGRKFARHPCGRARTKFLMCIEHVCCVNQ